MTPGFRHMRSLMGCAIAALLVLAAVPLQAAPTDKAPSAYILGVFPYMAPRQTVDFFGPVAANMEAALKHQVRLQSVPTFADFRQEMAAKRYDIALIQPFQYPEIVEEYGYIPLAQYAEPMVTQLYVRDTQRYKSIDDLRGTTIAMPPAESANARMGLKALHDHKLIPGGSVEVRYFNSHDSCLQQVWAGTASACFTNKTLATIFEERMKGQLNVIHTAPPIPHVLFVANPRVPLADRVTLQQLIIGWTGTEEGRAIMKPLAYTGFVAHRPAEYAMMRNYDPVAAAAKAVAPAAGEHLVLGVFPYLSNRQLVEHFAPALKALGQAVGMSLNMRTAASYAAFQAAVVTAAHDIVFVQPFDYALAVKHGYLPLAGMKNPVEGVFSVLEDSPYRQIADLKGKMVAMPPADAALSRLGRHALTQAGLTPNRDVKVMYTRNHDACIQALQRGLAATCIISLRTLDVLPREMTQGVRTMGQTQSVPGALFMAHKRIQAKTRDQLQAEIIGWKDSETGREILKSLQLGEMVSVDIAAYERMSQNGGHN